MNATALTAAMENQSLLSDFDDSTEFASVDFNNENQDPVEEEESVQPSHERFEPPGDQDAQENDASQEPEPLAEQENVENRVDSDQKTRKGLKSMFNKLKSKFARAPLRPILVSYKKNTDLESSVAIYNNKVGMEEEAEDCDERNDENEMIVETAEADLKFR